ncbi:hypothetical protein AB0D49_24130 [Streptomyces sp. NPDC048290]|uniref:hypothetical protein n=1 Tax=Streptomyces sp. NPDC048290 TaxID=3155811 RepID=UPI003433FD93
MGHRGDPRRARSGIPARPTGPVVYDRCWRRRLRGARRCAAALLALLLTVDALAGTLDAGRALLWTGLAVLLFVVLLPARVSAGDGWLAARSLSGGHRVRTDLLVSVRCGDGVSRRLVLRDTLGNRVEIDPRVLAADPALWHQVDTGARRALAAGTLRSGAVVLRRLSAGIDAETARGVFKVSDLD